MDLYTSYIIIIISNIYDHHQLYIPNSQMKMI